MKRTLCITAALGITGAWLIAQNRQPVILAGGDPVPVVNAKNWFLAQQALLDANGNVVIVYATPDGAGVTNVVLPGQPPNRLFTNEAGEVGVFWAAGIPAPLAAVAPVVTNATPKNPINQPVNRLFTNADGDVGVFWVNPPAAVVTNALPQNQPINRLFTNADGAVGVFWGNVQPQQR